jgi:hypothetical protein
MKHPAIERNIPITQHGRYLIAPAAAPAPILAGFHGYAESADIELERLQAIEGSDTWHVLSVQGLNRFYRGRTQDAVAGWMTTQDRELAIADNCEYVKRVVGGIMRPFIAIGMLATAVVTVSLTNESFVGPYVPVSPVRSTTGRPVSKHSGPRKPSW